MKEVRLYFAVFFSCRGCALICRYKTEGIVEAAPETVFHFINPTTADSPRNEWDKSITKREILDQPHHVRVVTYAVRTCGAEIK